MKTIPRLITLVVASIAVYALCAAPAFAADGVYSCGTYSAGDYQGGSCDLSPVDTVVQPITQFVNKTLPATGMQTPVILSIAFLVLIGLVFYFLAKKRRGKDEQEDVS